MADDYRKAYATPDDDFSKWFFEICATCSERVDPEVCDMYRRTLGHIKVEHLRACSDKFFSEGRLSGRPRRPLPKQIKEIYRAGIQRHAQAKADQQAPERVSYAHRQANQERIGALLGTLKASMQMPLTEGKQRHQPKPISAGPTEPPPPSKPMTARELNDAKRAQIDGLVERYGQRKADELSPGGGDVPPTQDQAGRRPEGAAGGELPTTDAGTRSVPHDDG